MSSKKEDRSGWVAVGSDAHADAGPPPIRPARSAYHYFQKENAKRIQAELTSSGKSSDVGALGREVSSRWQTLTPDERRPYEVSAAADRDRFAAESHRRDVEVSAAREARRRERETLILDDQGEGYGGRATRKSRQKGQRKAERKRAKKEEKKRARKAEAARSKKKTKKRGRGDDDDDSDYDESAGGGPSSDEASYSPSSSEASSASSVSSSDEEEERPRKKRVVKLSESALKRRAEARAQKAEKEAYIEQRQSDVREEKAAQAKRRLEFLLKQSDIFSHFGNVKAEKARLGLKSSEAMNTSGLEQRGSRVGTSDGSGGEDRGAGTPGIVRKPSSVSGAEVQEEVEAERDEVDEHEATFLTAQPGTLGGGDDTLRMRQYQLEGLNWMIRLQENGVNGILADEMGLGKTMQSISILVYMMEYKQDTGPHLIIVPKSTLSNWMNELARWGPTLNVVKFHGNKEERADIAENVLRPGQRDEERSWNVCVTTYEIVNLDRNVVNKFAWSYLVIDEAHRLKNEASTFSRVVRTLETRFRLLLTGTPLQNNLHELWALLNFLVPDVFASSEQFDEWFNLDIADDNEKSQLISQLHKILRPFMLRRLKADVEKSLPPKVETILFTGMSAMQKKLYKDILMRDLDTLTGKGGSGSRTAVLNIVMQLRKCAGHPYLFPGVEDRTLDPLGEHLVENCGKLVLLDKLLVRLRERGHRVLVFTQMTRILDIMEDYMHMRGFKYCRIDGNTSYEDREARIDSYNKPDSEQFCFLLSTRAGGLGINLQTADVVILYDSDWNPQADLQAQDRAHRIGQKREVQVFRLVTEDTIEQKVVERAQQKLKLDAMVVQQGRLKEKDKLSREELLDAIRFGADKIFKSKDSSITDDDIDLILDAGKKKTQELNDKLQEAKKGDMLDFKLDGGISAQTFEGVDYSKEEAKSHLFQEEIFGILDMGKRERRNVAYNENQLYMQQVKATQQQKKATKKKEVRLPRAYRLPKMEDCQMFDREALNALQDVAEKAFRALPEEVQLAAGGYKVPKPDKSKQDSDDSQLGSDYRPNDSSGKTDADDKKDTTEQQDASSDKKKLELPPLLTEEQEAEKARLLAEGFIDWSRHHYTAFLKGSGRYGRTNYAKIANEVGKPASAVETYAKAFWDEEYGKKRLGENEYERAVKHIEKGEKKIDDIKGLQRGTRILISLFENPWVELQFTHVNTKDKKFSPEEDRYLLCWAHKFGYGQWEAIKFAIRRSSNFRFDYFLKSLPPDALGRRCEQLMRAAEKEIDMMEKAVREEAEKEGRTLPEGEIKLPMFKELQAKKRLDAEKKFLEERTALEDNLRNIDAQIEEIQRKLLETDGVQKIDSFFKPNSSAKPKSKATSEHGKTAKMKQQAGKKRKAGEEGGQEKEGGAPGPGGEFVLFPQYDGEDEPNVNKKAFTLFCKSTRREVRRFLGESERKNKDHVNGILKERWEALSDDERYKWNEWEAWDEKRYEYQLGVYENKHSSKKKRAASVPRKKK